ncbi:MAG: hypothetical protein A3J62_03985 [Candidatus Buchananbacteria bacterium RIFCSPHIGHO2_02_FULL_38_8]|uniref:Uncharacterized protein n=1 Tax=Candidatus Buchananbacteria bacterium RIFCSPHIGHO2_02_FULL_38_8 TaxID=1797538 RepID=A0A1G1Y5U4_9BACT|nr:MAG: hypothetical protein A3J62_03985 [Candidatus Buchananbacteria bacterium RIFCSPHIGHO2_02_FULL_38_8]
MDFISTTLGIKLVYILGITNIISILLVFFSCRCMMGMKFFTRLAQYQWYKKFYSKHCYYWWLFIISVLFHTFLVFFIFGNPF